MIVEVHVCLVRHDSHIEDAICDLNVEVIIVFLIFQEQKIDIYDASVLVELIIE